MKKFVKIVSGAAALAAGIGTIIYLIKDKRDREDLAEDFDDEFDDDFEEFEAAEAVADKAEEIVEAVKDKAEEIADEIKD